MIIVAMSVKQHINYFVSYVILRLIELYACACMGCECIMDEKYIYVNININDKYFKHIVCSCF